MNAEVNAEVNDRDSPDPASPAELDALAEIGRHLDTGLDPLLVAYRIGWWAGHESPQPRLVTDP
jgi:hypothetical protein